MKDHIIKGMTIGLFSMLVVGFVAYRSGSFGGQESYSAVDYAVNVLSNQMDTIPEPDSLKKVEIIPSSKAIILSRPAFKLKDSGGIKKDTVSKVKPLIISTKRAVIFKPDDFGTLKVDSTVTDSLKKK